MADIQPKNTDTIRVNTIKEKTGGSSITLDNTVKADTINEKTASNGVRLNSIYKFTTAMIPLTANVDIGTSTAAEHAREIFAKELTSNGQAIIMGTDSAHSTTLKSNALNRFALTSAGDLEQDATNGGNVKMTKASTALAQAFSAAVTAAGTVLGDATDLTAVFNNVTTVGAGTGVQLWDAPQGSMILVRNAGANALAVYPHDGTGTINGGAGGASVSVATATLNLFFRTSATAWIGLEFAVAAA